MTDASWNPPVSTGREGVLVEDFPVWLREALMPWFQNRMNAVKDHHKPTLLLDFQIHNKSYEGFTDAYIYFTRSVAPYLRKLTDDTYTNLLDFTLWRNTQYGTMNVNREQVERVLNAASSKWTVTEVGSRLRLTERVPQGVKASVGEALNGTDAAAQKLQEAWLDAFGTNPRASIAYYNAVVAVENAALAVIPVNHPEPQLSNLFSILEAENPKWQLALRDSDKAPGAKSLAAMLRTLLRGQESRHGSPEDYKDVGLEQARAAVMLAATLVWWFRSGVVVAVNSGSSAS